jgi:hypothetical protein
VSFSKTEEICIRRDTRGIGVDLFPGADLLDPFMVLSVTYNLSLCCAILCFPVTITLTTAHLIMSMLQQSECIRFLTQGFLVLFRSD